MAIILGIDPGSQITGYGIVSYNKNILQYVTSGCLKLSKGASSFKLKEIFCGISEIVRNFKPDEAAVESVFVRINVASALKLGEARGAALAALAWNDLPVSEYSPRQVKLSSVGYGGADKAQVQHMVKALLRLSKEPKTDEADALAVAICHAHTSSSLLVLQRQLIKR